MATQPPPQAPTRRLRKRVAIPVLLLALITTFFIWIYWRGSSAETTPRNPRSSADGPVAQLLTKDGATYVRCAILVNADPAAVWKVVTDYDGQADFLPYASQITSARLPDGRVRITGLAHSRLWGDWPFESFVTEHQDPARGEYAVAWSEESADELALNRGNWTISRTDDGQTLLAYALEVEVRRTPPFLVRNILLNRLPSVLRATRDEVLRRQNG